MTRGDCTRKRRLNEFRATASKIYDVPRYIAACDTRLPAQLRYLVAIKLAVTVTFVGSLLPEVIVA